MRYKEKLIISGKIIEHFKYEKDIISGFKINTDHGGHGRAQEASEEDKLANRAQVQYRARSMLRRLINANAGQWKDIHGRYYKPKFLTLTFADNITDLKSANKEYEKFMKRFNRFLGYKAEYVCVVEFQKRGAVHYHVVYFNLPYISAKKIAVLWGQGFLKINAVEEVDNVGAYVSKYMGKDLEDDKLKGQKCYFGSRGLKKPVEIKEKALVQSVTSTLPGTSKRYETTFENEYTGQITYVQYNLNKGEMDEKESKMATK